MYLLLEKRQRGYEFIDKGDLSKVYRLWIENPADRIIVKEVKVEVNEVFNRND